MGRACSEAKKIYISQDHSLCHKREKEKGEKKNSIKKKKHISQDHSLCHKREKEKGEKKVLHQPGIEPGSVPWQGTILPLDHWC